MYFFLMIFGKPRKNSHQEHTHKLHFFVMNFKGDWKYLKQLFLLTKDASKEKAGKMLPASLSFFLVHGCIKKHGKINVALLCHLLLFCGAGVLDV